MGWCFAQGGVCSNMPCSRGDEDRLNSSGQWWRHCRGREGPAILQKTRGPSSLETLSYYESDGVQVAQRGCGVSSLQSFKSHQNVILGTLLEVTLLEQGLEQVDPDVASHPNQSAIL